MHVVTSVGEQAAIFFCAANFIWEDQYIFFVWAKKYTNGGTGFEETAGMPFGR